jgi:hypothetical protein
LDKDKNLAHQEEVLNNAGFDLSGQAGRLQDPGRTLVSMQTDHSNCAYFDLHQVHKKVRVR